MMRTSKPYLWAKSRDQRVFAPGRLDVAPNPEDNPTSTYRYDAQVARAWWGFILHAYRTGNHREAWELYSEECQS